MAGATKRTLADGNEIPLLGLGVWQVPDGPSCVNAVGYALDAGYRHLDTAQAYGNEASVGKGLAESGVPRAEVFLTTKFYPGSDDPVAELERSLERLGTDYVDLYLVHWPQGGPTWAWPRMQACKARGLARSIGVSNFSEDQLDDVLALGPEHPVVNQVRFGPFDFRRALAEAAEKRHIVLEAYSTLGTGQHLSHPAVVEIAATLGRTPAQVLLRWCIEREVPVIPKSTHRERIEENARIFDFSLPDDALATLDALDETDHSAEALERRWW